MLNVEMFFSYGNLIESMWIINHYLEKQSVQVRQQQVSRSQRNLDILHRVLVKCSWILPTDNKCDFVKNMFQLEYHCRCYLGNGNPLWFLESG